MKGKLNRRDGDYWLHNESGETIASSWGVPGKKLSIKNCDEIFGVVDVEKLAEESWGDKISSPYHAYIEGFNKAMELNKDKVFTLEDIDKAYWAGMKFVGEDKGSYKEFIQTLQQPTEIEVEILMRNSRTGNIVKHDSDLEWDEDGLCDRAIPKLDSEGCLILKKI
jgi:hypothetical protein